jgi:aminoglycoside phosphotransferase (APT) family kinase protein
MNQEKRMHADELEIDEALVRRLLVEQFPKWSELQLSRVEPAGTDNAIFRLGDELALQLARREGPTEPGGKELDWLPRLAPLLPRHPCPRRTGSPEWRIPLVLEHLQLVEERRFRRGDRRDPSRTRLAAWRRYDRSIPQLHHAPRHPRPRETKRSSIG